MPFINCEVNLILTWSADYFIIYTNVSNQISAFSIAESSLSVAVVTLSTEDNANLLTQLKSGFKRAINWTKCLSKPELFAQNSNLNHLVEPNFQGVKRLFVLAIENDAQITSNKRYYLSNVKRKDYNVMNDGKNLFDQSVENNKVTYENIRKITTSQGDYYATGCLLDDFYFKNDYKIIVIDLSKQQALDVDLKAIQQINFTANLDIAGNTRNYFTLEEVKETILDFSQGNAQVVKSYRIQFQWMQFHLII